MNSINIFGRDIYYHDSPDPVVDCLKNKRLYGQLQYNLIKNYILEDNYDSSIIDYSAGIGTFSFIPAMNLDKIVCVDSSQSNIDCLRKTFHDLDNVTIENESNIDQIALKANLDKIKLVKYGADIHQIEAIENSSHVLSTNKPVLLVTINNVVLRQINLAPINVLAALEKMNYVPFLYNGDNFLITIDQNSIFPFCVMDVICIHKDNIHKYIGQVTLGTHLPNDVIDNILRENLESENYPQCEEYLRSIKQI